MKKAFAFSIWSLIKTALIALVMFFLFVAPSLMLASEFSNGNLSRFGENQLQRPYGGLFTEVASFLNTYALEKSIIVMTEDYPLQYYLNKNLTVMSLTLSGNLAALRAAVESNSPSFISVYLHELGVRYFLEQKETSPFKEQFSNRSILLDVMRNPMYFRILQSFQKWNLYESIEGSYAVVKGWESNSTKGNWSYFSQAPMGNYSFENKDGVLNISISGNSSVMLRRNELPSLNTSEYQFVACNVRGSSNARWLFRLFSKDGTSYDFPFYSSPTENWKIYVFDFSATRLKNQLLDSNAYLEVQSNDNNPSNLQLAFYIIYKYKPLS